MNLLRNRNNFERKLKDKLDSSEIQPSPGLWDAIDAALPPDAFETKLKASLDQYQEKPSADFWPEIESSLPQEDRQKWFVYLTYSALAAIMLALVVYFFKPVNLPLDAHNTHPTNISDKAMALAQTQPTQKLLAAPQSIPSAKPASARLNQPNSKSQQGQMNTQNKVYTITTSNPPSQDSKSKILASTSVSSSSQMENAIIREEIVPAQSNHITDSPPISDPTPPSKSLSPLAQSVTPISDSTIVTAASVSAVSALSSHVQDQSVISDTSAQNAFASSFSSPESKANSASYSPTAHRSPWSISAYSGANMCFQNLKAPSNQADEFSKNIALRKSLEKPATDWSGSFLLNYQIHPKWKITTGICMTNFKQSVRFTVMDPVSTKSSGEPGAVYGNETDSIIPGSTHNSSLVYAFTEIPIWIEYTCLTKPTWSLQINGGFSYGILSGVNAQIIDKYNVGVLNLTSKNDFPPLQNVFFFSLQPAIMYTYSDDIQFGISPSFKTSLNSLVQTQYWVQQYPWFLGLNAKITKSF